MASNRPVNKIWTARTWNVSKLKTSFYLEEVLSTAYSEELVQKSLDFF